VVRTIQSDLLADLMLGFYDKFPKAWFGLLTHDEQHTDPAGLFNRVHYYNTPADFSAFGMNGWELRQIRRHHYDLAIIPHHQESIEGFENVLLMLLLFGVKRWAHCNRSGELRPVSKLRALRAVASGLAALGPAAALYAGYLVTILLQEKPWRSS
jgi:hypothetical protein